MSFWQGRLHAHGAIRIIRVIRKKQFVAAGEERLKASSVQLFRGNILALRGDTAATVAALREAVRRDSTNVDARGRLRDLGQRP